MVAFESPEGSETGTRDGGKDSHVKGLVGEVVSLPGYPEKEKLRIN